MPITPTETTSAIRRPALSTAAAAFLAKKHQMRQLWYVPPYSKHFYHVLEQGKPPGNCLPEF